ncbi:hypothetical protein NMG60_11021411 [Bertholletia excelsa]
MEPYGAASNSGAEAQRWLSIAEKLLAGCDFVGSRTFAIRARESDPRLEAADQILTVVDTLIAGEKRINKQHDWYAILQLPCRTGDSELVANQYRRLAITLNPHKNRLSFADQAFKLVSDAWSVLSNPSKKSIYDKELTPSAKRFEQQHLRDAATLRQIPRNNETMKGRRLTEEREFNKNQENSTFWTACPYCFHLYEYPRVYVDCSLRCQNCQRAFQGVKIPGPTAKFQGKEACFGCWGFFPLGVSMSNLDKNKGGVLNWNPFSPMLPFPQLSDGRNAADPDVNVGGQRNVNVRKGPASAPRIYIDDEEVFAEISESSEDSGDDDWAITRQKKKRKSTKGKGLKGRNVRKMQREKVKTIERAGGDNQQGESAIQYVMGAQSGSNAETSTKAAAHCTKKQKGKVSKEQGRLDLNVEFSNEVEDPGPGINKVNGTGNNDVDGMEGIGFFDGLDEFWSNLPIVEG